MAFGILTCYFAQKLCYLLCYFLPLLNFQCQLASFNSTLIYIFGKLLRLGFLECLKASLVHQQFFLVIFKSGIGLVFVEVIALTTYLGSWGFVAQIIASNFLQGGCPFLLGAIRANISSPLPFQAHCMWAYDLLLLTN